MFGMSWWCHHSKAWEEGPAGLRESRARREKSFKSLVCVNVLDKPLPGPPRAPVDPPRLTPLPIGPSHSHASGRPRARFLKKAKWHLTLSSPDLISAYKTQPSCHPEHSHSAHKKTEKNIKATRQYLKNNNFLLKKIKNIQDYQLFFFLLI